MTIDQTIRSFDLEIEEVWDRLVDLPVSFCKRPQPFFAPEGFALLFCFVGDVGSFRVLFLGRGVSWGRHRRRCVLDSTRYDPRGVWERRCARSTRSAKYNGTGTRISCSVRHWKPPTWSLGNNPNLNIGTFSRCVKQHGVVVVRKLKPPCGVRHACTKGTSAWTLALA